MARRFNFFVGAGPKLCDFGDTYVDYPRRINSRDVDKYINSYDYSDYCDNTRKGDGGEYASKLRRKKHKATRGPRRVEPENIDSTYRRIEKASKPVNPKRRSSEPRVRFFYGDEW
jgi:hypothetical protein